MKTCLLGERRFSCVGETCEQRGSTEVGLRCAGAGAGAAPSLSSSSGTWHMASRQLSASVGKPQARIEISAEDQGQEQPVSGLSCLWFLYSVLPASCASIRKANRHLAGQ